MSGNDQILFDSNSFPAKRYEALSIIGQGAAGVVYLCRDRMLGGKKVAIKCLRAITADQLVSFQREAKATSLLTHPGVVAVLDFGSNENGAPYMVMEYVEGASLEQILREKGPFDFTEAVPIFIKIAEALGYAHSKDIYHRDLKSSNILLVKTDVSTPDVRIIDFGVASVKQATQEPTIHQGRTIVGTPTYMSPDQAKNLPFDARSEIYALGCVMFEALTGRVPFIAQTALEVIAMHANEPAPALSDAHNSGRFPPKLEALVARCLEKDPADRFQSMRELVDALTSDFGAAQPVATVSSRKSRSSVKPWAVAVAVAALGLAGFIGYQLKLQSDANQAEELKKAEREEESKRISEAEKELSSVFAIDPKTKTWQARGHVTDLHLQAIAKFKSAEVVHLHLGSADSHMGQENISKVGWAAVGKLHLKYLLVANCAVTDECMRYIGKIREIERLDLSANPVTDKGISNLTNHEITCLILTRTNITDESTKSIATMPKLRDLIIADTTITDVGLANLKNTPVRKISLSSLPITDEGMKFLGAMPKLQEVYIDRTPITLQGLKHLARLDLESLDVNNVKSFNDDCMKFVAKTWPNLRSLDINELYLNDEALASLRELQNLRRLDLSDSRLDDRRLQYIAPLKRMDDLILNMNNITDEGVGKLVSELPKLRRLELTHTKVTGDMVKSLRDKGVDAQCFSLDSGVQSSSGVMELLDKRLEETGDMFGGAEI